VANQVLDVELTKVESNPDQPRKHFNQAKLEELALSLKEHGLVQPIIVKRLANQSYQIIAGERRWRASKLAGLSKIPVIVRDQLKSTQSNDLASLIENIQREELSPVELANSYERMIRIHGFTQEALAQKLGLSRVAVANTIRLLKLPEKVKEMLIKNQLGEGHARALLGLREIYKIEGLADQVLTEGLTVRDVETRVKQLNEESDMTAKRGSGAGEYSHSNGGAAKANTFQTIEDELRILLGTKVSVKGNDLKGSIEIYFSGKDSLNRIIHQLRSSQL
jgi:ParB family chromosome partitioning protein